MGHYLTVREWAPNFNPLIAKIDRVAIWVRIPTFSLEFYTDFVLKKIGNKLGRIIKIDTDTKDFDKVNFARICVEVDLSKSLVFCFKL